MIELVLSRTDIDKAGKLGVLHGKSGSRLPTENFTYRLRAASSRGGILRRHTGGSIVWRRGASTVQAPMSVCSDSDQVRADRLAEIKISSIGC